MLSCVAMADLVTHALRSTTWNAYSIPVLTCAEGPSRSAPRPVRIARERPACSCRARLSRTDGTSSLRNQRGFILPLRHRGSQLGSPQSLTILTRASPLGDSSGHRSELCASDNAIPPVPDNLAPPPRDDHACSSPPANSLEEARDGPAGQDVRMGRRSLALFLPLMAAVSATSRAAAEVAAPERLAPLPIPSPSVPAPMAPAATKVRLDILEGCTLGVSIYPDFEYNPKGGGGVGTVVDLGDGRLKVDFDPKDLYIPPLTFDSTTFVGLPLPPPLKIRIVPKVLSGFIDKRTGQVNLAFKSKFYFTAGPIYAAPPLTVETILTTDSSVGSLREGEGRRLDSAGQGTLVAVAQVPPVNDGFLDRFLSLPTDVLAVLPAKFTFET